MVGNKVKLHLRDVVSITKNKVMSVFDNGILVTHNNSETKQLEKYQFGQFDTRDLAYKRIDALWRNIAPEEVWKSNRSNLGSSTDNEICKSTIGGNINFKNHRERKPNHTDNEKSSGSNTMVPSSRQDHRKR